MLIAKLLKNMKIEKNIPYTKVGGELVEEGLHRYIPTHSQGTNPIMLPKMNVIQLGCPGFS